MVTRKCLNKNSSFRKYPTDLLKLTSSFTTHIVTKKNVVATIVAIRVALEHTLHFHFKNEC